MALGLGSIAFTGFNSDGADNLSFVILEDIVAGTAINFTDNEWNGSTIGAGGAFNTGESGFTWTATASLAAGTIVTLDAVSGTTTSNFGSVVFFESANKGISNSGETVYAYVGTSPAPTAFLAAISNDGFGANGSLVGTGLVVGQTAIDLALVDAGADIAAFNGARTGQAAFAGYLPSINTASNWISQDAAGDQSADGTAPDVPFSTGAFTLAGTPSNVIGGIRILDQAASLAGSTTTPVATNTLNVSRMGGWLSGNGPGGSESITFDHTTDRAYVTNATADRIDILDLSNPAAPAKVGQIELATLPGYGNVNSVAVRNGLVAVAVQNVDGGEAGLVALYDGAGTLIKTITVGVLPDQLTFSPDGNLLLVANEAERFVDLTSGAAVVENAAGSITIIDVSGAPSAAAIRNTIGFSTLDASEAALDALGIKTYDGGTVDGTVIPDSTVSEDIEPEYITVSPDGTKAYVTLQEVNAVAVIDLTNASADRPVSILPLGFVDFSLPGNEADFSDRDGAGNAPSISVGNSPVKSLLQPDAIASFAVGGLTYFVTANEGDSRIATTSNGGELTLNEARASAVQSGAPADYARLNLDTVWSTSTDIYGFGGRGFSIFQQNPDGTIVKVEETGGDFEQIIAALPNAGTVFNGENGAGFDTRSDNKGAEPEGIAVGVVNGKTYAFVALERIGGVMVWDVSTPSDAQFVQYLAPTAQDYGPEVIKFVGAGESPTGRAMLIAANEVTGSVTTYDIVDPSQKTIMEIQGTGHISPLVGQILTTTGVVTAIDTNGSRGFYIQDPNGDGNAATSDGVFVFTNAAPSVTVGQLVSVKGTVAEFTPSGAAPGSFSGTQITATAAAGGVISVLGAGPQINATVIGGPGGLLPPSSSLADASAFYESLEGMLVTVKEAVATAPTSSFGEIYTVVDNDLDRSNGVNGSGLNGRGALPIEGGAADFGNIDIGDFNPERLQIDDDNGILAGFVTPKVSTGAQLGDVTGVVNYDFGNYQIVATQAFAVEQASPLVKETTTVTGAAGRLTIASYNAENLDPNDGAARFATVAQEIVANLKNPDVVALQEIQDNDGPGNAAGSTVTAANVTLQMLVDALNAAAPDGVEYAFIDNPFIGDDTNGGEGGGNIRTAYLYRTDRVDFVDGSLRTVAADGSAITDVAGNLDQANNPDNPFFDSRVPLAADFAFNGQTVTIVNNHFTSKGGSGALYGSDPTPPAAGEIQRAAQAQAINTFVDNLLGADPAAKIVVAGDLNDFEFEQPLSVLTGTATVTNYDVPAENPFFATASYAVGGNAILTDMVTTLPASEAYDYVFEGNAQTLDHILVSQSLLAGAEFDVVRINAEFADQTSDHDPLMISLDIPAPMANFTLQLLHFSDAESGLLAAETAPNLAALVDAFDDAYANTLILSSGDNLLPGPFIAAGTDPSVREAINYATGSTIAAGVNQPIAAADIAMLNAIGVEASAIGNHEFDLGSRVLRDAITPGSAAGWNGANFAYLSANLDFSGDADLNARFTNTLAGGPIPEASTLKGRIAPSAVITEGGEKIGLVGATTQLLESISSPTGTEVKGFPTGPGANGEVDDMALLAAQLQPVIDALIAQGVNKIIVQSHLQQIANEQQLATLLRGVDIIIGGGSNTRLADSDDVLVAFPGHAAEAEGTYPIVTAGADGKTTLIVNTDGEFTYLGRLVVEFDANGELVLGSVTNNTPINGAYAATAQNVAAAWNTTVDNLANTAFADGTKGDKVERVTEAVQNVIDVKDANVAGYSEVYLEGERAVIRNQETNFGDLSADANAFVAQQALGGLPYMVSLKNGGGVRAAIGTVSEPDPVTGEIDKLPPPNGEVSQLDIENALRFDNKLMVYDTTPQGLLNILNWGAGLPANSGGFPQIGGVRYSFDPTLPGNSGTTSGARIRDVALIDQDGNVIAKLVDDGVVLANAPATISVVTLNFTANGGDGYPVKANGSNFRYLLNDGTVSGPIDEALDFTASSNVPGNTLGEQQAFFAFMRAEHGTAATAYDDADTPAALDTRIQNISLRADTVLDGPFAGTSGDDVIIGSANYDFIDAKAGNDIVVGGGSGDHLRGGPGNDVFTYQSSQDSTPSNYDIIVDFQTGSDRLDLRDVNATSISLIRTGVSTFVFAETPTGPMTIGVTGHLNASDISYSGSFGIYMIGDTVGDTLIGSDAADPIVAGAGDDVIRAGAGNDYIHGGLGGDVIFGDAGADTIAFSSAADSNPTTGSDMLFGFETGSDKIDLTALATSSVSLIREGGSTFLFADAPSGPVLISSASADINGPDVLVGGRHGVYMIGDATANTLIGSEMADAIEAGAGNDLIRAGAGNDYIHGGLGGDVMFGGAGADTFGFSSVDDSRAGSGIYDSIHDFQSGVDKIDLRSLHTSTSDYVSSLSIDGSTFLFAQNSSGTVAIILHGVPTLANGDVLF